MGLFGMTSALLAIVDEISKLQTESRFCCCCCCLVVAIVDFISFFVLPNVYVNNVIELKCRVETLNVILPIASPNNIKLGTDIVILDETCYK